MAGRPPVRLGDRRALSVRRRPRLDVCPPRPEGCGLAGWHHPDCPLKGTPPASPPGDGAKRLQEIMARHGYWLEQDEAVRLTLETRAGLPVEELIEQAKRLARPLTAEERGKLATAGLLEGEP